MPELLVLWLCSAALGLVVWYACWSRVRVILVRQRIYSIRDHLWDEARAVAGLRDPDYLRTRRLLNDAVHAVDWLSLPVILAVFFESPHDACETIPTESNATDARLRQAIDRAQDELLVTCRQHVLCRLSGLLIFVPWVCVVGLRNSWSRVTSWLERWLADGGLHRLAVIDRVQGLAYRE